MSHAHVQICSNGLNSTIIRKSPTSHFYIFIQCLNLSTFKTKCDYSKYSQIINQIFLFIIAF